MTSPFLPGSVIGVLGSGQLGRMFAMAARQMGYRVHTFSPDTDTPAGQVADKEISASFEDMGAIRTFAQGVQVVTFEFENIPVEAVNEAQKWAPVFPGGEVLHTAQHRLREKMFLSRSGFPVVPFEHVKSEADVMSALKKIGTPAVLKSAGFGYDGKGQKKIESMNDAKAAYQAVGAGESVVEAFIAFDQELSVISARSWKGDVVQFASFGNDHASHILDVTVSPAPVKDSVKKEAAQIAHGVMEALNVVGVLCVEFFLTKSGKLLINELAPRPHNSGHLTIDACLTSQFEQQLRAVCGLPLGATDLIKPAAMANLLGEVWGGGEPRWEKALAQPGLKLHLYGKSEARPGRKMGHLTVLADSVDEARKRVIQARHDLAQRELSTR